MFIYPTIDQLPHDPSIEYVIVSYKSQTHYRLVHHKGKVRFKESELPNVITDRFCKRHHDGAVKGVDDASFDTEVIETTSNGDCFFDSIYRATRADEPDRKPGTAYAKEVEAFRKEIAKDMEGNPIAQKMITQIYIRQTEESYDSIKEDFFKKKYPQFDMVGGDLGPINPQEYNQIWIDNFKDIKLTLLYYYKL
jgi:hypothetical protein